MSITWGTPKGLAIPAHVLQQTSVHSYSGGFIRLPTHLIVARTCSCHPTMLKKFNHVVLNLANALQDILL